MNATIKSTTQVASGNAIDTISRASLISMGAISGLIGLWAMACMVGVVTTNGIGQVATGFVSALIG